MKFERSAGILLHPSSLPGPFGIGDIGPQAHLWLDFLQQGRLRACGRYFRSDRPAMGILLTNVSRRLPATLYLISPEGLVRRRSA